MSKDTMDFDTLAIHADAGEGLSDVAPAIHASSTYLARSAEEFDRIAGDTRPSRFYARYGNPTAARAEQVLAALEGTEAALLFSSGMGAISTTVLASVGAGEHVVAQCNHYMGTIRLLTELLPRFGVTCTLVEQGDTSAFENAIRPETRLILVESPSNPTLGITDLAAVAAIARQRGITTLADNTFASPVNQQPHALGIDLVVHSATKYLGGHSDLVAGALCGSREKLDAVWSQAIVLGATSNAFDAFLLLRGLRTLPLRVARQNESALRIAHFLHQHPAVGAVYYPGLPDAPGHALARRQMQGFGGVLSFEVEGGFEAARACVSGLELAANAVSLGGVETLAAHVGSMWEGSVGESGKQRAGIAQGLVRLAIGLEHPDDLERDLNRALERAAGV